MDNEGMPAGTLISVEEYLNTSYRPDCDYVDGEVLERNLGEHDHSRLQISLAAWLRAREKSLDIYALTEQRVQVSPTRFRIPDICVLLAGSRISPIIATPPFLCIEILSSEDRISRVQERVDDYLRMGVSWVWIADPQSKHCYIYSGSTLEHNREGLLFTRNPGIELRIEEVLAS